MTLGQRLSQQTWPHGLVWLAALGSLLLLASVRVTAGTEFAVTSLALLPVMLVAWSAGKLFGMLAAGAATAMWFAADLLSDVGDLRSWVLWANSVARLATYCLVASLVAWVRALLERERAHAMRDELTGLANRRMFIECGEREMERSRRYRHAAAVLFVDLDNFKQLNDGQGHEAGDAALRAAAGALHSQARTADTVARIGGDEFAILLPEVDQEASQEAAARMECAVNAALAPFHGVTASVGVAWFEAPPTSITEMLSAADSQMYRAKCARRSASTN